MTRVAIVTGSAGGIGQAICRRFQAAHWKTIGLDVADASMSQVDEYHVVDLNDCDAIEEAIQKIGRSEGRINSLVNNAAHQVEKSLLDTSVAEWDRVMNTNVRGPFWLLRCTVPFMPSGDASVVNIASVHARATSSGLAAYVASKGALTSFTRAAALELASRGIRVNALLPGAIDTPMLARGLSRNADDALSARQSLVSKHPLGRIGTPEDIAESVLFLADGTRSGFITGQSLVVDGGALAQLSTE